MQHAHEAVRDDAGSIRALSCTCDLVLAAWTWDQDLATQDAHQPVAFTALPGKITQGPWLEPAAPW